jgi:FkbM family methyltransferase
VSFTRKAIACLKPIVERYPRFAEAYRTFRDQAEYMRPAIQSPWGFKLGGNEAMARGEFEPTETELVRELLCDVDVLVNIGANVGYYCCHALSMGKQAIAFEPMQRNLRFLCQNIKANGWREAEIFPLALSSKPDVLEIYGANTGASLIMGWAGTPENHVTLVPASTLDLVMGPRLRGQKALILMDVEGAEFAVLQGATDVMRSGPKPVWLIEIASAEHQPQGVMVNPNFARTFEIMWEAGYIAFTADRNMREVTKVDVDAVQTGDVQRFETHNFLFK